MTFAVPWLLLLVVPVPFVLARFTRRRAAVTVPAASLFAGLPPGRARLAARILTGLSLGGLGCLAIAAAGPRLVDAAERDRTEGVALMLVADLSGSMGEPDFFWPGQPEPITRLDALKRVVRLMIAGGIGPDGTRFRGRPDDLVGLVAFARRPENTCPLTTDHDALLQMLDAEKPRGVIEATTNLGDALVWALHRLEAAGDLRRVIVLFSDGEQTEAGPTERPALRPRQAARLLAAAGVPVYTIDPAGDAPAPEFSEQRDAGRKALQAVAALTGGRYFRADDGTELTTALAEFDQLERRPLPIARHRRHRELAPWLAVAAVACLAAALALELTVWRGVP